MPDHNMSDDYPSNSGRDCKHGQLARSCEICELEQQVQSLLKTNHDWQKASERDLVKLNRARDSRDAALARVRELEAVLRRVLYHTSWDKGDELEVPARALLAATAGGKEGE